VGEQAIPSERRLMTYAKKDVSSPGFFEISSAGILSLLFPWQLLLVRELGGNVIFQFN
jgi:hypothetical protein